MNNKPYKVLIVVDPAFGERLAALPSDIPVWVVDTPANRSVVSRLWKERPDNHLVGITIFTGVDLSSPEKNLIEEFSTIDLHHGSYSSDPPYTELEVFGVFLTPPIQTVLAPYGFRKFQASSDGFCAKRECPDKRSN